MIALCVSPYCDGLRFSFWPRWLRSRPASAQGQEHWVATWATAQALVRPAAPVRPPAAAAAPAAAVPSGPATTPQAIGARGFNNQTVRMIVRTSIAGKRLRVRLTNAFGSMPVAVGTAHLAIRAKESAIVPDSDRKLELQRQAGMHAGTGRRVDQRSGGTHRGAGHGARGEPLLPRRDRTAHHARHRAAQHLHLEGRRHDRAGGRLPSP